jgi:hypothetical protein
MALEMETFCSGLVSSMDEQPTISEIMHKAIAERTFPGGAVAFGSCTVPCYYQGWLSFIPFRSFCFQFIFIRSE